MLRYLKSCHSVTKQSWDSFSKLSRREWDLEEQYRNHYSRKENVASYMVTAISQGFVQAKTETTESVL